MSRLRKFGQRDIELLKYCYEKQLTLCDQTIYAQLGRCEYELKYSRHTGARTAQEQIHNYICLVFRALRMAKNMAASPWDDNFEIKPEFEGVGVTAPPAPAAIAPPAPPTVPTANRFEVLNVSLLAQIVAFVHLQMKVGNIGFDGVKRSLVLATMGELGFGSRAIAAAIEAALMDRHLVNMPAGNLGPYKEAKKQAKRINAPPRASKKERRERVAVVMKA